MRICGHNKTPVRLMQCKTIVQVLRVQGKRQNIYGRSQLSDVITFIILGPDGHARLVRVFQFQWKKTRASEGKRVQYLYNQTARHYNRNITPCNLIQRPDDNSVGQDLAKNVPSRFRDVPYWVPFIS